MRSSNTGESNIPMFLTKLWKMVEDPATDDLVCWSQHNGSSTFTIRSQARFASEILPFYYKHNNMASFVRQLNMYGFRKISSVDQGALKVEKDDMEFYHVYFSREHKNLLHLIKRKVTMGKSGVSGGEDVKQNSDVISTILTDVSALYSKQESVNTQLSTMKRENEALWREVATLRQQHLKQQQIVSKMIQFLLNLVRPNRGLVTAKRKLPLMLDEAPHSESKIGRLARAFSYDGSKGNDLKKPSSSGPVIHDITDTFDSAAFQRGVGSTAALATATATAGTSSGGSAAAGAESQVAEEVLPSSVKTPQTLEEVVAATVDEPSSDPTLASPNVTLRPDILDELFSVLDSVENQQQENLPLLSAFDTANNRLTEKPNTDLIDHVGTTQMELEHLKEMLANSGCTLDFSTMLSCFPSDNLISMPGSSDFEDFERTTGNEIVGNELIQYNPNVWEIPSDGLTEDGSGLPSEELPLFSSQDLMDNQELIESPLFEHLDAVVDVDEQDEANNALINEQTEKTDVSSASNFVSTSKKKTN